MPCALGEAVQVLGPGDVRGRQHQQPAGRQHPVDLAEREDRVGDEVLDHLAEQRPCRTPRRRTAAAAPRRRRGRSGSAPRPRRRVNHVLLDLAVAVAEVVRQRELGLGVAGREQAGDEVGVGADLQRPPGAPHQLHAHEEARQVGARVGRHLLGHRVARPGAREPLAGRAPGARRAPARPRRGAGGRGQAAAAPGSGDVERAPARPTEPHATPSATRSTTTRAAPSGGPPTPRAAAPAPPPGRPRSRSSERGPSNSTSPPAGVVPVDPDPHAAPPPTPPPAPPGPACAAPPPRATRRPVARLDAAASRISGVSRRSAGRPGRRARSRAPHGGGVSYVAVAGVRRVALAGQEVVGRPRRHRLLGPERPGQVAAHEEGVHPREVGVHQAVALAPRPGPAAPPSDAPK